MSETQQIKKDIFVAVVSNGSTNQKENWKEKCEEVFAWVMADGSVVKRRKPAPKKA